MRADEEPKRQGVTNGNTLKKHRDCYYFSHDCNARNDPKILPLRSKYGAEGYGIYWMIIEILREQPDYKYPISEYYCAALAMQMNVNAELVGQLIEDCCSSFKDERGTLLCKDKNWLYSKSLLRRMEHVDTIREKRSRAAKSRWENEQPEELMPNNSTANAEQVHMNTSLPSMGEVTEYIRSHGYRVKPEDFLLHLSSLETSNWKSEVIPYIMKMEQNIPPGELPMPKHEPSPTNTLEYSPGIAEVVAYGKQKDEEFDRKDAGEFLMYFGFLRQKDAQYEPWRKEMDRWGQTEKGWE